MAFTRVLGISREGINGCRWTTAPQVLNHGGDRGLISKIPIANRGTEEGDPGDQCQVGCLHQASSASRFCEYQINRRLKPSSREMVGLNPNSARAFAIRGRRRLGLSTRYSRSALDCRMTLPA